MSTTRACYHCCRVDCHCVSFPNNAFQRLSQPPALNSLGRASSRTQVSARAHTPAAAGSNPARANRQSVPGRAKHPTVSPKPIVRGCTALLGSARCGLNSVNSNPFGLRLELSAVALGVLIAAVTFFGGCGDFPGPERAHAADDAFIDTLDPLDAPLPVSAVLFVSVTSSARDERLAMWKRLAQLELVVLDLMERIDALEHSKQNAPAGTEAQGEASVN